MSRVLLFISDLQIPFEAPKALEFCVYAKRHFKIDDQDCYCVGDEIDANTFSQFDRDPNGIYTPRTELERTKHVLKSWYKAFPRLKIANSNHQERIIKKATKAELPIDILRSYHEILDAPQGWVWKDYWQIKTKHREIIMEHGVRFGGVNGAKQAIMVNGKSTIFGHHHSYAQTVWVQRRDELLFGINTGCLIDVKAYAFNYSKDGRFQPTLGVTIVLDDGKTPVWLSYGS